MGMSETIKFLYLIGLNNTWEILRADRNMAGGYTFLVGIREYAETYKWVVLSG